MNPQYCSRLGEAFHTGVLSSSIEASKVGARPHGASPSSSNMVIQSSRQPCDADGGNYRRENGRERRKGRGVSRGRESVKSREQCALRYSR